MCLIWMGYKKLIFVHLIENINSVPKIANLITRRKNSQLFVELIRLMKLLMTGYSFINST